MAFDPQRLRDLRFPCIEHSYGTRDCILYALGVGYGDDPLEPAQLAFLYEEGLMVLPTFASMLAYPGFWYRDLDTGLDASQVVHLAERIELHAPIPACGIVVGKGGVVSVDDLGPTRGARVVSRRRVCRASDGVAIATITQTALARGNGGFADGGSGACEPRVRSSQPVPDRAPDHVATLRTSPRAALIFRLSGDVNPLHVNPESAARAGFPRPVLHGLATYGFVGRALVACVCAGRPERLRMMDARFTAPVFPGEEVTVEAWVDGSEARFRALVGERVVVDHGAARFTPLRESLGDGWRGELAACSSVSESIEEKP